MQAALIGKYLFLSPLAMPTAVVQQPPAVNMMEDKEDTEEEVEDAADNQTEPRVFLLSGMTQRVKIAHDNDCY